MAENEFERLIEDIEKERTFIKVFDDILNDDDLDVYDAYIYGIIYSFNSKGKPCCYSQKALADKLKKSRKFINERINKLVKKGWLEIEEYLPGGIIRFRIV